MTNVIIQDWTNPVLAQTNLGKVDVALLTGQSLIYTDLVVGSYPAAGLDSSYGTVIATVSKPTIVPVNYPASGYWRFFRIVGPAVKPSAVVPTKGFIVNGILNKIFILFSGNLNALSIPDVSDFVITDSAGSDTTTAITIASNIITLTKSRATNPGDTLSLAYLGVGTQVQDDAGLNLLPFSGLSITNNVVLPTRTSVVIDAATPTKISITFSALLNAVFVPAASAFTLANSGGTDTVSGVTVAGNTVVLTKSRTTLHTDVITLTCTQPGLNPLQDTAGEKVATFTGAAVSNGV